MISPHTLCRDNVPQVSNFLVRKFTLWYFQLPRGKLKAMGNNSKAVVIALKSLSENNDVNVIKTLATSEEY